MMQTVLETLHNCLKKLLLSFLYRYFAEFLKIFHEGKSSLAGACASSLVSFNYLSLSVYLESCDLFFDLSYKFFHKTNYLMVFDSFLIQLAIYEIVTEKTTGFCEKP